MPQEGCLLSELAPLIVTIEGREFDLVDSLPHIVDEFPQLSDVVGDEHVLIIATRYRLNSAFLGAGYYRYNSMSGWFSLTLPDQVPVDSMHVSEARALDEIRVAAGNAGFRVETRDGENVVPSQTEENTYASCPECDRIRLREFEYEGKDMLFCCDCRCTFAKADDLPIQQSMNTDEPRNQQSSAVSARGRILEATLDNQRHTGTIYGNNRR